MLQERLGFDPHVIEAQLGHSVRGSLGRAYNRTEFVEQRRKMREAWADWTGCIAVRQFGTITHAARLGG